MSSDVEAQFCERFGTLLTHIARSLQDYADEYGETDWPWPGSPIPLLGTGGSGAASMQSGSGSWPESETLTRAPAGD